MKFKNFIRMTRLYKYDQFNSFTMQIVYKYI